MKLSIKIGLSFAFAWFTAATSFAQVPEWIWHDHKGDQPTDNEIVYFRTTFTLETKAIAADLVASCDNRMEVFVNGKSVARSDAWEKPAKRDVASFLKNGENVLAVRGQNSGGAAALIVRLEASLVNSKRVLVLSDANWRTSLTTNPAWESAEKTPDNWAKAKSLGKLGARPWGDIFSATGALPKKLATSAESLTVLKDFKVELLRSAEPNEGSWVSMTADPKGRLIISPQGNEPMLRVTLSADGKVAKIERIELPPRQAMGLLYAFDSLYVNGRGPDDWAVYRLTDTNGDDQYDKFETLRKWQGGGGEHGTHGIVLGPDKKLYVVCGNFVGVPTDLAPTSQHKNYADDVILPRMEDGNGFGAGRKPPGGYVVRMDPDGKNCELFAAGQRNTYDIAFNRDGELFGFDSDMEWDWGTPWYRPTRIYHITSGADHGFREGTAKWPEHYQDSLPATVNIGIGSPTGVRSGAGAKFPAKYQDAMYILDWSYGRIMAVHLQPNGASYSGSFENFVAGKPLNVTDLEVGKDGAMYFTTGGRGTQSGLYRVTYTGSASTTPAPAAKISQARDLRHQLEAFHGKVDPKAVPSAWPHLDSNDRFIRYAARIAIEAQPVEQWKSLALSETKPYGGLTALIALARVGGQDTQADLLGALKKFAMASLTEDQQLLKLRVIELSFIRQGRPAPELISLAIEKLSPLYPAKSFALNRELSQILIYLEAPGVVQKTLQLVAQAKTQEEQLHYLMALRNAKTGWTLDDRKRYFTWFRQQQPTQDGGPTYPGGSGYFLAKASDHPSYFAKWFADVGREVGNGSSYPKFLANLRRSAADTLTPDERNAVADLLTDIIPKPVVAKARPFVKEWKMSDLERDLTQVEKGRNFARGKEAFTAAQCFACHRFGEEGGAVGPDITAVISRFSRRDILESIVDPSKVVSEQYQNITVLQKDGEDVTGRLVEDTNTKLVLVPNQLTGDKVEILKNKVAKITPSKLSPMPEGLINVLTKEEILDMLAYIESAGKKDHRAFAK
ncbi:MAG: c-type cytochrome [Verrucomicrobiota bacterium]